VFKRRRGSSDDPQATAAPDATGPEQAQQGDTPEQAPPAGGEGPFDVSAAPEDGIARVDLGGLQIPIVDNMQLHLDGPNEDGSTFALATIVLEERQAAMQLMAVAAPRSGGFWAEVMDELETDINGSGGSVSRSQGRFGEELTGTVMAQDEQGNAVPQPARFMGAEGNRWFIRAMLMGTAATETGMGEFFEDIVAGCVVDRGERPMAPGDLIPLTPPVGAEEAEEVVEDDEQDQESRFDDLEPFERGPEITETR
jgi:hypothetical protein